MLRFVSNIVPLLEINKQTMTRIGLLSDTHSYWDDKYLKYFEECDEIWHAGDIGSVEVAERLAAFRPFRAVYGNIDGQEIRKSGSGSDSAGVAIRNVAGEMLGSMTAVNWAIENKYPAVEIRYDYEGVEKWVTGVWRAKTPLTSKYAAHMQEAGKKVQISFCKIAAHTGNHYNEEADQLAKSALLKMDEEVRI